MRELAAHTVITQFIRWHLYCSLDLFKLSCIALPECITLPESTLICFCIDLCCKKKYYKVMYLVISVGLNSFENGRPYNSNLVFLF